MKVYKITNHFEDERGLIENITPDVEIKDILYITGKKGAIRGNHHHIEDEHYCYVTEGKIKYCWQEKGETLFVILNVGDCVYTPKLEKHRFEFLTDGAFTAMAIKSRKQEDYEKDTVRGEF